MRVTQIMEAYFERGHTACEGYVFVGEAIGRPGVPSCSGMTRSCSDSLPQITPSFSPGAHDVL